MALDDFSYECFYSEEDNFIIGHYKGELNLDNVKICVEKIAALAQKHNCKRFLNDLREAKLTASIVDIYDSPQILVKGSFDQSWARAQVVKKEDFKKMSFFEDVAVNRGLNIKIFTDIDQAKTWLQSK